MKSYRSDTTVTDLKKICSLLLYMQCLLEPLSETCDLLVMFGNIITEHSKVDSYRRSQQEFILLKFKCRNVLI